MMILQPPQWLLDGVPPTVRDILKNGGWYGILGIAGLLLLLVVATMLKRLFGSAKKTVAADGRLMEDLNAIPPPPASTGDRRLQIEGVPVRVRLVVVAPAGRGQTIRLENVAQILDLVVPGLRALAAHDKPVIRLWPVQLSDQGFVQTFHANTPLDDDPPAPSRWVTVAGRAHIGNQSVFLGLALQAIKPTTIGRRHLAMHEWGQALRIRTKD